MIDYDRNGTVSWPELLNWTAFDDHRLRALAGRLRLYIARDVATGVIDKQAFEERVQEAEAAHTRSQGNPRARHISDRSLRKIVKTITSVELERSDSKLLLRFLAAENLGEGSSSSAQASLSAESRAGSAPPLQRSASTPVAGTPGGATEPVLVSEAHVCSFLRAHVEDCFETEAVDVS